MKSRERYAVVFVTVPGRKEGRKIASGIIESRLAACVNIIDKVESHYRWLGKVETAQECLLIIKTKSSLSEKLIGKIRRMHSYSVPEIIFFTVAGGDPHYLEWIGDETA